MSYSKVQTEKTLYHSIDRKNIDDQQVSLIGWALSKTGESVELEILDSKKSSVKIQRKVMLRPDASMTMLGDESQKECGFQITFPYLEDELYVLILKDSHEQWSMKIDVKRLKREMEKEANRHYQPIGRIAKHMNKSQVKSDLRLLLSRGYRALKNEWFSRYALPAYQYEKWYELHRITEAEKKAQMQYQFSYTPKISILVPTYKTPEAFLRQMLDSVKEQTYANWELCIADGSVDDAGVEKIVAEYSKSDDRIRYRKLEENKGISGNSNAALEMATGDYIALLDHDDLLTPDALFEVVQAINEEKADVIYSDEDKISMDLKHHFEPHFKPDLNIDLLRSNNYICHFFVSKTEYVRETGGFRSAFDGAQDFDLIFRCIEKAEKVYHIPRILYHWRMHQNSTAANPESKMYCYEAGLHAIEEHLKRVKMPGKVSMTDYLGYYRVEYPVVEETLLSILIFDCEEQALVQKTRASIESNSCGLKYEVITDSNLNLAQIKGNYILCLRAGMQIASTELLSRWLGECERAEVGMVGAKVYSRDNLILHCGQIIGENGQAIPLFRNCPKGEIGYFTRAKVQQNLSSVSLDAVMMKKEVLLKAAETAKFEKMALFQRGCCEAARKLGYQIVCDPGLELVYAGDSQRLIMKEAAAAKTVEAGKMNNFTDRNYNPNLDDVRGNFQVWIGERR